MIHRDQPINPIKQPTPYRHLQGIVWSFYGILFFAGLISHSFIGVSFLAAAMMAVVHLSAMWTVLGPRSFLWNSTLSLFCTFFCGASALIGVALASGLTVPVSELLGLAALGPIVWVVAQIPWWLTRFIAGWQIQSEPFGQVIRPIQISELLIFTAQFAVSLSLLRLATTRSDISQRQHIDTFWPFLMPLMGYVSISFLLICLPAVLHVFRRSSADNSGSRFALWVVAAAFVLFAFSISTFAEIGLLLSLLMLFFSGLFLIPLILHRNQGLFIAGRQK